MYDISVLVLTYNSEFNKLKITLDSIIEQEDLNIQVVIADDGSKIDNFSKITEYFKEHKYKSYKLIKNKENQGTVINFYHGLLVCEANYVKSISPGDMFIGKNILKHWLCFMKEEQRIWSFCETVYYKNMNEKIEVISVPTYPNNIKKYLEGDDLQKRWQYVVLNDLCVGASMLFVKDPIVNYCKEIIGKIKYAEDHIWRMAMFDGSLPAVYDKHCILYEYGTGISTCQSDLWKERLQNDWVAADNIIVGRSEIDLFQEKMIKAITKVNQKYCVRKIFVKGYLRNRIALHFFRRYSKA